MDALVLGRPRPRLIPCPGCPVLLTPDCNRKQQIWFQKIIHTAEKPFSVLLFRTEKRK